MRPGTFLLAVLAVAPFSSATTQQQPPPVKPGDRVRIGVCTPVCGTRVTGSVLELRSDALLVKSERSGDTLQVALASLGMVEVSRGQKSRVGKGALIGVLVGVGLGAGVGFAVGKGLEDDNVCDCHPAGMAVGGLGVGALGALIGAGVGAATKSDRWEEVPLDQLRVSFVPQRDGRFGLGLSLRF